MNNILIDLKGKNFILCKTGVPAQGNRYPNEELAPIRTHVMALERKGDRVFCQCSNDPNVSEFNDFSMENWLTAEIYQIMVAGCTRHPDEPFLHGTKMTYREFANITNAETIMDNGLDICEFNF